MASDVTALLPPWIRELIPYPPGKPIEELEREYGITGSIKLASNENPIGPSPKAVAAVREVLADANRYPDGGTFHLRRRLAEKLGRRPEQFILGNGSNEIIELIVRAFVRPGDEIVMADQAFVIYRMVGQAAAATPRIVPLRDFTHDLEAMAEAVTGRTRVVFLANPNNPTGTIYGREAWEHFLEAMPPQVIVVADEAYAEFVDDPSYPDSIAYQEEGRLLVTLRTFSKAYGLAGLRVGYGVARADVIDALHRIRQPFNVNALAQVAARAALDDDEHLALARRTNKEGMTFLRAACDRLGLSTVPSWANFLLIDVGQSAQVYEALLHEGVIVRPMGAYQFPRHIRVTVGRMEENERFVASLERVLSACRTDEQGAGRSEATARRDTRGKASPAEGEGKGSHRLFERMAVIGVGLIGGSLALAAKRHGIVSSVVGCGRSAQNLQVALDRGIIDVATHDPGEAVRRADVIVLATPVGTMATIAGAIRRHLPRGAVVSDVASVKVDIVSLLEPMCRDVGCAFVGAHPVAGSEDAGAAAADASLFQDRRCILTPTAATEPRALADVRALWETVGMRVEEMDAEVHDLILARVSHAPHVVAYALAAAVGEARVGTYTVSSYAGSGLRDTTRIAGSSATLWRGIALANREGVLEALGEFQSRLEVLTDLIKRGDGGALEEAFSEAREHRKRFVYSQGK